MRLLPVILLLSCAGLERVPAEGQPSWPRKTPAEANFDDGELRRALSSLPGDHGLHSFLVIRDGALLSETYWAGYDENTLHDLRSATKSITSLLAGIAIKQGSLTLDRRVSDRHDVTVNDLLTMRSGLACDDRDPSSPGNEERMYATRDWVRFFDELPVAQARGTKAAYCTAGVVRLGRVIEDVTGETLPVFAQKNLFGPLGIEHARWATFDENRGTDSGGHLKLRPRDLAKLGQLVLDKGRALLDENYVTAATQEQTRIDAAQLPYGFLWWLAGVAVEGQDPQRVIFASGNGGQLLFIVPQQRLVVVSTGGNFDSPRANQAFDLLGAVVRGVR